MVADDVNDTVTTAVVYFLSRARKRTHSEEWR
jgi:hypothetical protein